MCRGLAVLLAVPLLAASGCGDDEGRPRATPTVTERTAPPTDTTPRAEPAPARTAPAPQATPPASGGDGGGTPAPSAPRTPPDGPGNDIKPEPGTPESRFEQECDANPADCG